MALSDAAQYACHGHAALDLAVVVNNPHDFVFDTAPAQYLVITVTQNLEQTATACTNLSDVATNNQNDKFVPFQEDAFGCTLDSPTGQSVQCDSAPTYIASLQRHVYLYTHR